MEGQLGLFFERNMELEFTEVNLNRRLQTFNHSGHFPWRLTPVNSAGQGGLKNLHGSNRHIYIKKVTIYKKCFRAGLLVVFSGLQNW